MVVVVWEYSSDTYTYSSLSLTPSISRAHSLARTSSSSSESSSSSSTLPWWLAFTTGVVVVIVVVISSSSSSCTPVFKLSFTSSFTERTTREVASEQGVIEGEDEEMEDSSLPSWSCTITDFATKPPYISRDVRITSLIWDWLLLTSCTSLFHIQPFSSTISHFRGVEEEDESCGRTGLVNRLNWVYISNQLFKHLWIYP